MKTILVTGAAGYIGSKLCHHLVTKHNVIGVDNFRYGQGPLVYDALKHITMYNLDASDLNGKHLKSLVESADVIVPLAAIVGAPACDNFPKEAEQTNLVTIQRIVDLCKEKNPDAHIVFPNTNSGYGNVGTETICTEETPLNPISHYGRTKDYAEMYITANYPKHTVFRLATVFGRSYRHRYDLLVNTMVYEAVKNGCIDVFDDAFMRNYIHINDIVDAFDFAIDNNLLGVYNLGNDALNMTKGDLANAIKSHLHCDIKLVNKTDPDQRNYQVSSEKLYKTGFKPKVTLDTGIIELYKYYAFCPLGESSQTMRNA